MEVCKVLHESLNGLRHNFGSISASFKGTILLGVRSGKLMLHDGGCQLKGSKSNCGKVALTVHLVSHDCL